MNWTDFGNPVSTATNYSFIITGNHALTANFAMLPQTALFDFDTGWPSVSQSQGMPSTQSNNLLTAAFSTLGGGWSIQTRQSSVIGAPPSFAGNFLYPSTWWSSFQIQFSVPITKLAFDFMTGDVSSEYNTPSTVRITAYTNSVATPAVGSGAAQGGWNNGAYPDGHINFSSATPLAINIGDLMAFDYDPDGDPVYFTGVSATTGNGLALTTSPTQILVPSNSVADSFTYSINDGNGYNATGTADIHIITRPDSRVLSLDLKTTPGMATVSFSGVPWYYYTVQRATNGVFTGTVWAGVVQAWADGSMLFTDNFADLGGRPRQAFYRLAYP